MAVAVAPLSTTSSHTTTRRAPRIDAAETSSIRKVVWRPPEYTVPERHSSTEPGIGVPAPPFCSCTTAGPSGHAAERSRPLAIAASSASWQPRVGTPTSTQSRSTPMLAHKMRSRWRSDALVMTADRSANAMPSAK